MLILKLENFMKKDSIGYKKTQELILLLQKLWLLEHYYMKDSILDYQGRMFKEQHFHIDMLSFMIKKIQMAKIIFHYTMLFQKDKNID